MKTVYRSTSICKRLWKTKKKARYPMVMSRKEYPRCANFLYQYEHYALSADITKLYRNLTKHKER